MRASNLIFLNEIGKQFLRVRQFGPPLFTEKRRLWLR
jgi:hypothetical protein